MACVSGIASEKQIPRFARNDTLAACNGDFSLGPNLGHNRRGKTG